MNRFCIIVILLLAPLSAFSASFDNQILAWSEEKIEQLRDARRVGAVAEWQRKVDENDMEWLAVSLAVAYSIEKRVNEVIKGDRANTPALNDNLVRLRGRLVRLGEYVVLVNSAPVR